MIDILSVRMNFPSLPGGSWTENPSPFPTQVQGSDKGFPDITIYSGLILWFPRKQDPAALRSPDPRVTPLKACSEPNGNHAVFTFHLNPTLPSKSDGPSGLAGQNTPHPQPRPPKPSGVPLVSGSSSLGRGARNSPLNEPAPCPLNSAPIL